MKTIARLILSILLLAASAEAVTLGPIQGFCDQGGKKALFSGTKSTNYLQGDVPACTVTVYVHGWESPIEASYTSGGTIAGSTGETCTVTFDSGDVAATGTVTLTGDNTITSGNAITINTYGDYSSIPTTATLSNGTATCSGEAQVTATLGPSYATIYSDQESTGMANPFTAAGATSIAPGAWLMWVDSSEGYDIVLSGGVAPNSYESAYTWGTDVYPRSSEAVNTFPDAVANECVGTDSNGNFVSTGSPCGTGSGSGGVTSVGLSMPDIYTVTDSPVTTAGIIEVTFNSQAENLVFASPNGSAGTPLFRRLATPDFPFSYSGSTAELATVLGTVPSNVVAAWDANGNLIASTSTSTFSGIYTGTITASQVTGLAASATTDTTNASNITSGTLAAARLPASQFACPTGQLVTSFTINDVSTLSCLDPGTISGSVDTGNVNAMPYYSNSPTGKVLSASAATLDAAGDMTGKTLQLSNTLTLTSLAATSQGCLYADTAGNVNSTGFGCGINGTVTSVGIEAPSIFTVTNTPITSSGVITISANAESANYIYAGPSTYGADAAVPTFRHLVLADEPTSTDVYAFMTTRSYACGTGGTSTCYVAEYRDLILNDLPKSSDTKAFLTSEAYTCDSLTCYVAEYRDLVTADLPTQIFKTTPAQCSGEFAIGIDVDGNANCVAAGTVTSVGFSAPSLFTVTNSPITSSGTIAMTFNTVAHNVALLGPTGTTSGQPSFRAIVNGDLPTTLTADTSGNAATATAFATTPTQCSGEFATGIDAEGNANCAAAGNVTSVGLSAPSIFDVAGSPVTSDGTLTLTLADEHAGFVFAAPASANGTPLFRALVAGDMPATIGSDTTGDAANVTGVVAIANGGTNATTAAAARTSLNAASLAANTFTDTQTGTVFNATTGFEISGSFGTSGQCLMSTGTGTEFGTCTGGSVTSVALTAPGIFTVSGSPVTTDGTLAITLATEAVNLVWASPAAGTTAAAPTFRSLVNADLPTTLTAGTSGNAATATRFAGTPTTCSLNEVAYGVGVNGNAYCSTDSAAFLLSSQTFKGTNIFQGATEFSSTLTGLVGTLASAQVEENSTEVNVLELTIPTGDEFYITGGLTHMANNLTVEGTTILNGALNVGGVATMNVTDFKAVATMNALNTATSSANYGSTSFDLASSYYDASDVVETPLWTIKTTIGTGTTPENDLVFSFADTGTGVSGHTVILPSVQVTSLNGTGCLYADASGNVTANGEECGTAAGGTVSTFSAGNLSPLFTTSVATATTTPALTFTLSSAAAHTFFGNNTASSAVPAFSTIGSGDLPSDVAYTDVANTFTANQVINSAYTLAVGSLTAGDCVQATTGGVLVSSSEACQTGTVTSVAVTVPSQLTISGSPITTSGTLALGVNITGTGTMLASSSAAGTSGHIVVWTSSGDIGDYGSAPGGGSVTSVGLSLPSDFTVSNSPVTSSGTLTAVWATTPTGTGAVVRATSPTLVTPTIGVATATSINGIYMRSPSNSINVGISSTPSVGTFNAIFGNGAGAAISSSGSYNVLIGFNAALDMTGGEDNVVIGYTAADALTNATNDTIVGKQAANAMTGSNNVVFGQNGAANATSNTQSTYIGTSTATGAAGAANEIVVGYGATGAGANKAVIGNASVTDIYFGAAAADANIHATNAVLGGTLALTPIGSSTASLCTTTGGVLTNSGCVIGNSSTATIAVGAGAGTGGTASCASSTCTAARGAVTITAGTLPATGTVATATFGTAYATAPICQVTMNGGATFFIPGWSSTTGALTLSTGIAIAGTVELDYFCQL
jgi:hypothetical protein